MSSDPSLRSAVGQAGCRQADRPCRYGLTTGQKHLLDFVTDRITAGRPSPSFEEIRVELGLRSKSGVFRLVQGVVERGHLVHLPYRARSLALPGAGSRSEAPAEATPSSDAGRPRLSIKRRTVERVLAYAERKQRPPRDVLEAAVDELMRADP